MNGQSATEPSTPQRSRRNYGLRNIHVPNSATRIDEIHLPPNELKAINFNLRNRLQLMDPTPRRSHIMSRRSTITPTRPSRFLGSRMSPTPSHYSPLPDKKRRSSIVVENKGDTLFNPGYAGPITLEYLKYLCQIAIEEKEKGIIDPSTTDNVLQKQDGPDHKLNSSDDEDDKSDVGNQSLLIPDNVDELLKSPDNAIDSNDSSNPFLTSMHPNTGPKNNFSYLERILAAQSKKPLSNEAVNKDIPLIADTNKLQEPDLSMNESIENEAVDSPAIANQSFIFDDLNHETNISEEGNVFEEPIKQAEDSSIIPSVTSTPPGYSDSQQHQQEDSDGKLVQEEYYLNDDDVSNSRKDSLYFNSKNDQGPPRVLPTAKKRKRSSISVSVPSKMIKSMVSIVDFETNKSKQVAPHLKLTSEALQIIQDQSDSFLSQLMGDLEDYASYRKSHTIDIKDVMLYINRLKFPNEDGKRMETTSYFSSLARDHLPLESLLALQNGLKTTFNIKNKPVNDTKLSFAADFSDNEDEDEDSQIGYSDYDDNDNEDDDNYDDDYDDDYI